MDKVSKSGAKFDTAKLEFLNAMHIRDKFDYIEGNEAEARGCVEQWRGMLLEEMPASLHPPIRRMPDQLMLKVMDMMKVRMRYVKDIRNHGYFFAEPDYDTELGRKFIVKLKQPALTNKQILVDLAEIMGNISEEEFKADQLNKACSIYLMEQNENKNFAYKNEDVFFLLRYAMTGNPVGAPIGDISEVLGKKAVLDRLALA